MVFDNRDSKRCVKQDEKNTDDRTLRKIKRKSKKKKKGMPLEVGRKKEAKQFLLKSRVLQWKIPCGSEMSSKLKTEKKDVILGREFDY